MSRTYLLIADAFYPKELPPEAQTNTFLALGLVRRGWDVALWAGAGSALPPESPGLRLLRCVNFWGMAEMVRIALWIWRNRPERIGLAYGSVFYSNRGYIKLVPFLARFFGIPCTVLFTNGNLPGSERIETCLRWLAGRQRAEHRMGLLADSNRLVFYSEVDRNGLLGSAPSELWARTVLCTPPAVLPAVGPANAAAARAELGATTDDWLIGYFGLLYPEKGVEWLVDAIEMLVRQGAAVKLAVIGGNGGCSSNPEWNTACERYERRLRDKVQAQGLHQHVTFVGYVLGSVAAQYIAACDAICLPFDDGLTGTRSSFMECAALGVPIITTISDRTDAHLCNPECGILYVSPRNPKQIADTVLFLMEDKTRAAHYRTLIMQFATEYGQREKIVECFDGL
jgi:glycosyltransferase involved in cell wall biosynthesis